VKVVLDQHVVRLVRPGVGRVTRRQQRSERRRLARLDRAARELASLHSIRALLERAITVVESGWVQGCWFSVTDEQGRPSTVPARDIPAVTDKTLSGACLVGAIVAAGGGPTAVRTQPVQRALDLTWHALHQSERQPVRWCPAPEIRMAHVRDLTRWNDHPQRSAHEVLNLLRTTLRLADAQTEMVRVEQAATSSALGRGSGYPG
jgi:hypothetical protein